MPEGFAPAVLHGVDDGCEGHALFVSARAVVRVPALEEPVAGAPSALVPGVAREVWAGMQPTGGALGVLRAMTGAYNGPGGEPLFRWQLEQTRARPVVYFDRSVPVARALEVLRGASAGVPLRLGGVGGDGTPRCVIGLAEPPDDLEAQSANALFVGRLDAEGRLRVRGPMEDPGELAGARAPLARETSAGLHVVRFDPPSSGTADTLVRAFASARWSERRYGWLRVPPQAPHCLPFVSGCGCAEGCARGLAVLNPEALRFPDPLRRPLDRARVQVRVGSARPAEGRVERWCPDRETGRLEPVGPIEPHGCVDVYVTEETCGGECVPRALPDCGACEACDPSCAGAPLL